MYSNIASNKRRSIMIMMLFLFLLAGIGYAVELYTGNTGSFFVILIFALFWSLVSYFTSARMALGINGARQIEKSDSPKYYRTVENLAITTGLPMPKVYIIDDPALNAFATGRDPDHAVVCVTSGLLETLNDTELEAVLAHEMGHIQNYDIRLMMIVFACVSIIGFISDMFLRFTFWGDNDREGGNPIVMVLAFVLIILSPIIALLVQLAVSRQREYLADATGALTTRYPEGLISALEKIGKSSSSLKKQNTATAHLFFANPLKSSAIRNMFSTHPPIESRIARLQESKNKL